jgi:SAM-dependent methyltransferase
MSSALPFTGERFTPECAGGIWYEHWHRYALVRDWVAGKVVLDAACGEGYGSAFLAEAAGKVIGVDVSASAISHARAKYGAKPNLEYIEASVTAIPLPDASVDVVVSFETIEHLTEQEAMLAEFRRVLRPEGFLVLSAPNRPVYSEEKNYRNEYHVREHDRPELAALLTSGFPQSLWFAQRLQFNSVIWSLDEEVGCYKDGNSVAMAPDSLTPSGWMPDPMYFLVVCGSSATVLPTPASLALFADRQSEVLRQYERLMAWQWEAKERIQQLEGELAGLADQASRDRMRIEGDVTRHLERAAALQVALDAQRENAQSARSALELELDTLRSQFAHRNSLWGWLKWPFHCIRKIFGS